MADGVERLVERHVGSLAEGERLLHRVGGGEVGDRDPEQGESASLDLAAADGEQGTGGVEEVDGRGAGLGQGVGAGVPGEVTEPEAQGDRPADAVAVSQSPSRRGRPIRGARLRGR